MGTSAPELDPDEPIEADEPDPLPEEFAAIDALHARANAVLEGVVVERLPRSEAAPDRDPLIYDPDWDERTRSRIGAPRLIEQCHEMQIL
ncbi:MULTISPECIES: hypothetical protein [unclassified Mesorhizobium]|uniref:hypothetical protein n=1 Tax=unclassified Mesorhizobium TaxID=325217 RepID=UPI000FCBF50B|nr:MULTISPECIES: hypothetical protein [unclassified Mesorhizobium]RUV64221.1 hypothetical protein EOA85_02235 [Mesorhizobium sp. M5C.F.Ca.IN.020.29.1.1]RWA97214.1 MAG: hypothetical protein EOQ33_32505 [Mesorhizobium sp.]RWK58384.1 MAG: hypothetical protein EOR49_31635 [Mesorhizobium sp.]RWM42243.1 MAG: hypothetical protein EOR76_33225 [Mesorhizobium sp.]RWM45223.1 MAG: hypothetical protein EOR78_34525 [Mesorhizobium sp.]